MRPFKIISIVLGSVVLLAGVAVALAPQIVGTLAQSTVKTQINEALKDKGTTVDFKDLDFSWFSNTKLEDVVIKIDGIEKPVTIETMEIGRTFGGLFWSKKDPLTITFHKGVMAVDLNNLEAKIATVSGASTAPTTTSESAVKVDIVCDSCTMTVVTKTGKTVTLENYSGPLTFAAISEAAAKKAVTNFIPGMANPN